MNFRTTVTLGFILAVAILGYVFLSQSPKLTETPPVVPASPGASVARNLFENDLGDVTKVAVITSSGGKWAFEKETGAAAAGAASWKIVEPFEAKAAGWEIDRLGRDLAQLKYEISHPAGTPGSISATDAGLEPPLAEVILTNAEGKTETVQIGKPAGQSETYVRIKGDDRIVVGKSKLSTLIKKDPVEYRDAQAWNFSAENAKRLEITDRKAEGGQTTYVFVRDGAQWKMESPVSAKATGKVNEAVTALSRLRVAKWLEDAKTAMGPYGLDPAALTVKVTVEEQIPVEKKADAAKPEGEGDAAAEKPEEPETQTKTTVHELHVSNASVITEDTKTYLRIGNETVVGTIMKTTTDKLKPVMSEWRDMHLFTSDVGRANRVELNVRGQTATLVNTGEPWSFESGGTAEAAEVEALLNSIKGLNAAAFVDSGAQGAAESALATPQAQIALTIPGVDAPERLAIGGATDEASKRILYVRRGESTLAKVKATDVEPILRSIDVYRDRTVLNVIPDQIDRVTIERKNAYGDGPITATFAKTVGTWAMTEPAAGTAHAEKLTAFVNALAGMRAQAIAATTGDPASFGLADPAAKVTINVAPATTESEPGSPKQHVVLLAEHGGKAYARLADAPTIYEVTKELLTQAETEYRTTKLFDFDTASVTRFSIQQGGSTFAFVRGASGWAYEAEPDLRLNTTKVENLLLQIKDLEAKQFISYTAVDPAPYGLDQPTILVKVVSGDQEKSLRISDQREPRPAGSSGVFGSLPDGPGVFLLPEDAPRRLEVKLEELEAA